MHENEAETPRNESGGFKRRRFPAKRKAAIVLGSLLAVLLIGVIGFLVYASDYYHDLDVDHTDLVSTPELPVEQGSNYLAFGQPNAETALIFYPGAKIEYSAYAPLMRLLAEEGYLCIIVDMPFNFAFFNVGAADAIMDDYPDVQSWWIGGHSLGGAMAASYAAGHADALDGLALLGSYSADDLSGTDLTVCVVYGSNDEVLNRDKLAESRAMMPPSSTEEELAGGNHAYFGFYGEQAGDGAATITPEEQWQATEEILAPLMAAA